MWSIKIRRNRKKNRISLSDIDRVTLTWSNINVFLPAQRKPFFRKQDPKLAQPKHILKNVSGCVEPGSLMAIMGASGAGKSTLLNVLTYRNRGKLIVDGEVRVNGQKVGQAMTSLSAYVQQEDLFIGTLKVREHLRFQALLRMDKHNTYEERMQRVDEVIHELGLTKCANTMIGYPDRIKGVSGGERKRLSFASEILTNPRLMFCDEPTSGLDAFMAQSVISVLKNMAAKGKTIMCTIHQPSSEVYAMFDKLLLIADGRIAYMGSSKQAIDSFASMDYHCPQNFNPADFLVHTLAIIPGKEMECKNKIGEICDAFHQSDQFKEMSEKIQESKTNTMEDRSIEDAEELFFRTRSPYKASWFAQLRAVMWRSWISLLREPLVMKVRFFQSVLIALLLGAIYFQVDLNQEGIMNINGALFLFLTNMTFQNMFAVVNVFCAEMPVFLREHFNGCYRPDVYYFCKTTAELPAFIILPAIFTAISYWMIGLNSDFYRFLICVGIVVLVANVSVAFGYTVSTLTGDVTLALSIAPPLIIPLMLFGGFFLNADSVPVYFIWLNYLSWFKYGNEALSINQWKGVTGIECPKAPGNRTVPCQSTGSQVLDSLNFDPDFFNIDIIGLVALLVGFRIIAFIGLLVRSRRKF